METEFIPLDYHPFDFQEKNFIQIFGRDQNGKKICIIDSCDIFFWAILKENLNEEEIGSLIEKIKNIKFEEKEIKIENIEIKKKNFLGKEVNALKIYTSNYKNLQKISERIDSKLIQKKRGYDLGLITHYIIEKKIEPLQWYKIKGEVLNNSSEFGGIDNSLNVTFVIHLESFKKIIEKKFNPKILAYDIETDALEIGKGEILMISLYGEKFQKVITWKKQKTNKKYVEFVKDEGELLEKFSEHISKQNPDFLVGYNSDLFDLPYLKERAKKLKVQLSLGVDFSEPKLSGGMNPSGRIKGIVHVDLLKFIRTTYSQYMQSETLSLNEVSKEFLGENKKDFKIIHSSKLTKEDWEKYYEYNLQDSKLALNLFKKFWPDLFEFSKIIKEPAFEISRNGLSKQIEGYILHNLEKYNEIPERKPSQEEITERRNYGSVEGAFVYEPKPGIYENIVMFDFTSMHTSIIITHNISKENLTKEKKNSHPSPEIEIGGKKNIFYFKKDKSFFPELLREIFEKRKQYKEEYKKNPDRITLARSNAFKLLSASAHGYIAFFGARYNSREASSSILAFVRKYNKEIISKIKNAGYNVIYGDTDSVAFERGQGSKKDIMDLLEKLNKELPGVMHLELEDFFKRGIWVTTRSGKTGAKKKYALIDENNRLKIRGFETVRRDWCKLSRETQDKVLRLILEEGNEKKALEYTKKIIEKIKKRNVKKEDLIIKTQLKKEISEYKSISPHVIAAKKMKERQIPISEGGLIEYYISDEKGKLVREKVKLPDEKGNYDIDYYLEKQIIPSVENIFHIFNINSEELIKGQKQEDLKKWF